MMEKVVLLCCISLVTFGFVSISYAETFYLKDGSIVEGTVVEQDEKTITVKDAVATLKHPRDLTQTYSLNASVYYIKKYEIEKREKSKELSPPESTLTKANITEEEAREETIAIFKEAKEKMPDNPVSWEALGLAYEDNKDFDKAIEHYKKAIEIDKNYYMASARLAGVYEKLEMKEAAKKEYRKALLLINEEFEKNKAKLETLEGAARESFKKWTLRLNEDVKKRCEEALKMLEQSDESVSQSEGTI